MAKRIKKKIRKNPKFEYIKNKAIVHFIHQHLKKEKIDFSKIKIPSFLDVLNTEEDEININQVPNLNKKSEESITLNSRNLPTFGFSLLADFSSDKNEKRPVVFKSSIFKRD